MALQMESNGYYEQLERIEQKLDLLIKRLGESPDLRARNVALAMGLMRRASTEDRSATLASRPQRSGHTASS